MVIKDRGQMVQNGVEQLFSKYAEQGSVFLNKNVLTSSFIPGNIQHRDEEMQQLSLILAPVLRGFRSNNIIVYGKCGTGKTVCSRYVLSRLEDAAKKNKKNVKSVYINCKMRRVADTEYRVLAQILKELDETVPDTGLPTDVLYRRFFERIELTSTSLILILDEIDALYKKIGDEFLYNLTRINTDLKKSHVTMIGITNDLLFKNNLDSRILSSLNEEEIIFRPYDAVQLRDILSARVNEGFVSGAVGAEIVNKCAALAAQEHGDARRALDLLVVAGEVADRMGDTHVKETHIDIAEKKIDTDRVIETVKIQPRQSQAILYSIIKLSKKRQTSEWKDKRLLTGDVFDEYAKLCNETGMKVLTQRRISDLISELDMLGIISTRVISKGRYGRTREIFLAVNNATAERAEKELSCRGF